MKRSRKKMVLAVFQNRYDAERAFDFLYARGYRDNEINVLMTDQTRAKGLGSIDPAIMEASVALIARSIENGSKIAAKGVYDAGFLPQPPIKP